MAYAQLLEDLITELAKFPGIGRKSAEKLAFFILQTSKENVLKLSLNLKRVKEEIAFCKHCNNFSEGEVCHICNDASRDSNAICVVEDPKDIGKIERTGVFRGLYHVLMGTLSPLDGRGPEALSITKLIKRIKEKKPKEIILALGSGTESESTAHFLSKKTQRNQDQGDKDCIRDTCRKLT